MGSNVNTVPSERCAIVGVIDPDAYSAAAYTTAFVESYKFRRLMAVLSVGDIVSTGTVDMKLQRADDASGTNAEDISGASITQLTEAGGDSNKQVILQYDMQKEEGNAKRFVGVSVTLGTAGADMSAVLFGFDPMFAPASDFDASTVDEIKTV